MQDFLMPNEEQMQLMRQEYDKVLPDMPRFAKTNFAMTLPIYLVDSLQRASDDICEIVAIIESMAREEFYGRNKDILQMIVQICNTTKEELSAAYQYLSIYCQRKAIVNSGGIKGNLFKILRLQSQILRDLYTIYCQTKIKVFESAYQRQMLASIQMHSICI